MAQRVYMIPVTEEFTNTFSEMVLADSEKELEALFADTRSSATRHLTTLEIGKLFIDAATKATPYEKQDVFFGVATACRPYFITSQDYRKAASRATELLGHSHRTELFSEFKTEAEVLDLNLTWPQAEQTSNLDYHDEEWDALLFDLRTIRGMRAAFLAENTYPVEIHKKVEVAGIEAYSQDETETIYVEGTDLARQYGSLVGSTFGRIAGLISPTWWLGRNFWPGLMLGADLGRLSWLSKRPESKLQDSIAGSVQMPFTLMDKIAVPGFEGAFSPMCAAYGTGLFFPADSVPTLLDSLEHEMPATVALASRSTGFPQTDAEEMSKVLLESLIWATEQSCGLLEGDELVGSLGYR